MKGWGRACRRGSSKHKASGGGGAWGDAESNLLWLRWREGGLGCPPTLGVRGHRAQEATGIVSFRDRWLPWDAQPAAPQTGARAGSPHGVQDGIRGAVIGVVGKGH